jgi:hypothetical protein
VSKPKTATTEQVAELINVSRHALDDLELGVLDRSKPHAGRGDLSIFDLMRRVAKGMRDGYPTQSSLRGSGGAGTVMDDEGKAMPPVSDPVGELVADRIGGTGQPDAWRAAARESIEALDQAAAHLVAAVCALAKVQPPKDPPAEPGCAVHAKHKMYEEVDKDGLCRKCYEWRRAMHCDPPALVLKTWADGKRLTSRIIERAMRGRKVA